MVTQVEAVYPTCPDVQRRVPDQDALPKHVAIIMDGNGRWAQLKHLPRIAGHKAGVSSVRDVVSTSAEMGVEVLTLFAFSSENWSRPPQEVSFLMNLLISMLAKETNKLDNNNIQLRVIGEREGLDKRLQAAIDKAEMQTKDNTGLKLVIALNYGGRWDVVQAMQEIALKVEQKEISPSDVNQKLVQQHLSLGDLPEPDLFIRTSGELRISNFMLWQLAYTEMVFVDDYWPDFNKKAFIRTLEEYSKRKRRFGKTNEQVNAV